MSHEVRSVLDAAFDAARLMAFRITLFCLQLLMQHLYEGGGGVGGSGV